MRWTLSTLGSAATFGIGRQDAPACATAAYWIHPRMYAATVLRPAAPGDKPRPVGRDDHLGPVAQPELGQGPAGMGLGGRPAHHHPAPGLGGGRTPPPQ